MQEGGGHQGSKASKVVFLGRQNRLFTTGFSKLSERQHALWDAVSTYCVILESVYLSPRQRQRCHSCHYCQLKPQQTCVINTACIAGTRSTAAGDPHLLNCRQELTQELNSF